MIGKLAKYLLAVLLCFNTTLTMSYAEKLGFSFDGDQLNGRYLKPKKNADAKGVLLFVHGDGAITYDAHGYYEILWNVLRKNGYAIFSWDKPGVGKSQGNWLNQSMEDRQREVLSAIDFIQQKYGFTPENTGLIGFSQAGWVVPAVASNPEKIGFAIGIGFATNWIDQGEYFSIRKSALSGESEAQTQVAVEEYHKGIKFLDGSPTYDEYLEYEVNEPMGLDRFGFVMRNYRGDSTEDYSKLQVPVLLLWGSDDQNVDAQHEYKQRTSHSNPQITAEIIPNASHALLDSKHFKGQQFGTGNWVKLMWKGKNAFAEGSIDTILDWLEGYHQD